MKVTVFYCWQSWTNQKNNRYLIQKVIEQAIARFKKDAEFRVDCVLERDTKDLPGTPAIADSILQKIDNSDLFICDLTITTESINEAGDLKSSPNPNVLLELGYAVAKLGWEKVISVMNIAYGDPKKLPFDLQHRRFPITYDLPPGSSKQIIDKAKNDLEAGVFSSVKVLLKSGLINASFDPKDERVLEELERILFVWDTHLVGFLASIQLSENESPLRQIELEVGNINISFFRNPDSDFVKSIVVLFSAANLERTSPHYSGKDNWIKNTIDVLKHITNECEFLLQRYADRDETVISLVEDVYRSSRQLAGLISIEKGYTAISNVWSYGLEEFLIAFLQSYGVILEYKGKIEAYDEASLEEDCYGDF